MATRDGSPDPQPGQFWATAKGRTVEIVAREQVFDRIAYKFLGGSKVEFE